MPKDKITTRILLVEDNPGDADLIRELLDDNEAPHYEINHVTRLDAALKQLETEDVDLVLLDLSLPDCSGLETVTRTHEAAPETPIVVLTGQDGGPQDLQCIENGAQDYVHKTGLETVVLRRAIGYALERVREARISELQGSLERYERLLSSRSDTSVTRALAGAGPIRERASGEFTKMESAYSELLEEYLDHLVVEKDKPRPAMRRLATMLGDLGGGPHDLIDVHMSGLDKAARTLKGARARAYAVDGRLLALEMMGLLVDYYRIGGRLPSPEGEEK